MAYLILVRHGESVWNAKGLWTGWTDVSLSEKGREEGKKAGSALKDIKIGIAYTSKLKRASETLDEILKELNLKIPVIKNEALNEKNYGDYTGRNKWEIKKELGEDEFQKIRRSWDYPIPNGESLKDVYERVVPYYRNEILPELISGKNVIVSAHGNSLRALVKYLDNISDEDISKLEIATGEIYIYRFDEKGNILNKEIRLSRLNVV
ncbi:MAG: 2,3-diphosphoglycerate-dependent phosphoglycerate mutase [Candidatus Levybacteria bacterium]|nr:2,3-diphosphoglycerate-dependent phosphoglycerate mutase [Candidatus Levybacteria bacterium]